jgi:type IV pilus assembly protein PilC
MQKYEYSARTKEGAIVKGNIEAKSSDSVVQRLLEQNLVVVSVSEKVGFDLSNLNEINIGGVPITDKVVFMRQLSTMISAGIALTKALDILQQQATNPKFKKVLSQVLADIEGGVSFAGALKNSDNVFDDVTISLISAGEESGHLQEILERLAYEIEKKKKLADKLSSAFIYPAVILVVVVLVIVLMLVVLVPAMKDIYSTTDAQLPAITQFLVDASDFTMKFWWLELILISLAVIGVKSYLGTPGGRMWYNRVSLKIPIFGIFIIKGQLAQFTRVLSLLLKSGLSITQALTLTADAMSNEVFKKAVMDAKEEVEKGVSLAMPISRTQVFPIIISQMISVGEETGKLDEVLNKMSQYYEDEVDVMTSNISALLEPLILLVMGSVIAFVALAVYSPMFAISSAFGG